MFDKIGIHKIKMYSVTYWRVQITTTIIKPANVQTITLKISTQIYFYNNEKLSCYFRQIIIKTP